MKEVNYWEQFTHTGNIEDYLRFKNVTEKMAMDAEKQTGENPYAGVRSCYRNRVEDSAYRGIR
ncbi:MAG: hypothetical protein IJ485_06635 [Lachnospiraceae bacterium]|nr:hypothetical protein [Lachnospiraceae bacterium]